MDNINMNPQLLEFLSNPQLIQALNSALSTNSDEAEELRGKFDSKLPRDYRDQLHAFAVGFDARDPDAVIEGVSFDAAEPRWRPDFWPLFSQFDGVESTYVARSLEFIRPGVYAKKYPQLKWQQFLPADYSVDTGAESYTVVGTDVAGDVTIARSPSNNVNMVSRRVFEGSLGFFSMMLGYQYTLQEVRNAIFARRPLPSSMAMDCRNLMERKLDNVAFLGEKTAGVKGLLTLSGTATYATPATGAGGSKSWDTKSPASILVDLNGPVDKMIIDTNEVEIPDTFLLPTSRKRVIQTLRIGDGSDVTVERFFLANQEFIKSFGTTYKSEAAPNSEWTGKRGVLYCKDQDCVVMVIPQAFEQLNPVAQHFTVSTFCHLRTSGVANPKPQAVMYVDEI